MTAPLATVLATVLVVEDDAAARQAFAAALRAEGTLRVETAADGPSARALAGRLRPDLVLSDYALPGFDGIELCRRLRADDEFEGMLFVVITGVTEPSLRYTALDAGVDDFLVKPVDGPALLAKVRAMLRLKRVHDQLRAERGELAALRDRMADGCGELLSLLVHLLDLSLPGAAERGRRVAAAALPLATRFDVPADFHRELELAALLHEVGRLTVVGRALETPEPWRHASAAQVVLQEVAHLRPVADLIGCLGEHWDGTGIPGRRRLGEIPLRARLVRTVADFFALRDAGHATEEALARLGARAGTWYDPAVVAQLQAMLADEPAVAGRRARRCLPVEELDVGMVLAEDLSTPTGLKLLARGTTLSPGTLAAIRQRHAVDPILGGATVYPAPV